jgi:hypothetical protein
MGCFDDGHMTNYLVSKEKNLLFCYYWGYFSGVYRCSPGL